jgi:transcriptional regulator with XRE-family HTH domain
MRVRPMPTSDLLQRFGRRVRERRRSLGYSQEDFAEMCDLDRTYIGGVERGERNISLKNIGQIATALGISIATLLEEI